jgi:phosphomannomutase
MVTYRLAEAVVTLRASGTEPKLKFYLEAWGGGEGGAAALADQLAAAVEAELVQPQQHGLTRPQL